MSLNKNAVLGIWVLLLMEVPSQALCGTETQGRVQVLDSKAPILMNRKKCDCQL